MDIINIIVIATIIFLVILVVWLSKGIIKSNARPKIIRVRKTLDRATFDKIIGDQWPNASKKEMDDLYKSFVELIKVLNE